MKTTHKIMFYGALAAVMGCGVGGCGSSNATTSSGKSFEEAIRAPKGPPPPEAVKATQEHMAKENAAVSNASNSR
jgi:hypothetical protein